MNRSELVERVVARPDVELDVHAIISSVDAIINAALDEIVEALASGEQVKLRDFGTLYVSHRQQNSRHPTTGSTAFNGPMLMARFRPAERVRLRLRASANGSKSRLPE